MGTSFVTGSGANYMAFGPDGCIYTSQLNTVYRITDTSGACSYGSKLASPALVLSPTSVSPNPAQGTSQTFTADHSLCESLAGTQVVFNVAGANPQSKLVRHQRQRAGVVHLRRCPSGRRYDNRGDHSQQQHAQVEPGRSDLGSRARTRRREPQPESEGGCARQTVNLVASLTDVSQNPVTALSGETIDFSAGGQNCTTETNGSRHRYLSDYCQWGRCSDFDGELCRTAGCWPRTSSGFTVVVPAASPTVTPARRRVTHAHCDALLQPRLHLRRRPLRRRRRSLASSRSTQEAQLRRCGSRLRQDQDRSKSPTRANQKEKSPAADSDRDGKRRDQSVQHQLGLRRRRPRPAGKGIKAGSCEVSVSFTPTAAQKYSGHADDR